MLKKQYQNYNNFTNTYLVNYFDPIYNHIILTMYGSVIFIVAFKFYVELWNRTVCFDKWNRIISNIYMVSVSKPTYKLIKSDIL
jgi:hypothetical protein